MAQHHPPDKCDHHHEGHGRHHGAGTPQGQLKFAISLTGIVFFVELVGGFWTNSLALLSDAAHVFMDVFALTLSLLALYLAAFPPSDTRTYGLHRAEVFAALVNGVTLFLISLGIFYEASNRFRHPPEVKTLHMMIIAAAGMLVNAVVARKLHGHSHQDLNIHSAFLHVVSDLLASVGVVAGGLIMYFTGWFVVDPVISVIIGGLIVFGSGRVVAESAHILLEGVPKGVRVSDVAKTICAIEGVKDVHHLHVWSICSNIMALSSHVLIDPSWEGNPEALRLEINRALHSRFGITDTTLQFDSTSEAHDALLHKIAHPEVSISDEE